MPDAVKCVVARLKSALICTQIQERRRGRKLQTDASQLNHPVCRYCYRQIAEPPTQFVCWRDVLSMRSHIHRQESVCSPAVI